MKTQIFGEIVKNQELVTGIFDMLVTAPEIAKNAVPGQFVSLYTDQKNMLLPRPISICEIIDDKIRFVYGVVGKGTEYFSSLKSGDKIRLLGPVGNGYNLKDDLTSIVVGGGIGVPPLLECVKQLKGKKIAVLGFRENPFLVEEFEKYCDKVYVATDDGSVGFKGNVVDLIKSEEITGDVIYSCGPKIMLKFLSQYAEKSNIPCFVSMEERMGCAVGACVGCVIKVKTKDGIENRKVCQYGPVFNSKEVIFDD